MIYKWDKYDTVATVLVLISFLGLLLYRYGFEIIGGILFLTGIFCMFLNIIVIYKERGK